MILMGISIDPIIEQKTQDYIHKSREIHMRYLNQGYYKENLTPAQKRRIRKQVYKWRGKIVGEKKFDWPEWKWSK